MRNARELLSDDGAVIAMLCSHLALSTADEPGVTPLTLKEWNTLARKIYASDIKQPSGLLGLPADSLTRALELAAPDAERIARLLTRGGSMALELEHLAASGIWCITHADEAYPTRLRNSLKHQSPPVLFGAGELEILERPSIAMVGSRNLDERAVEFAQRVGTLCAQHSITVVSGGARGADRVSMQAALDGGGQAVGVLTDSLGKLIRQSDVRDFIVEGRLVLLTPYRPDNAFSIGAAMGRNKAIYGAADYAVVVSSEYQKGGTWSGAVENLSAGWCPTFVRFSDDVPLGNRELVNKGAQPLLNDALNEIGDLMTWMKANARTRPQQGELLPA